MPVSATFLLGRTFNNVEYVDSMFYSPPIPKSEYHKADAKLLHPPLSRLTIARRIPLWIYDLIFSLEDVKKPNLREELPALSEHSIKWHL